MSDGPQTVHSREEAVPTRPRRLLRCLVGEGRARWDSAALAAELAEEANAPLVDVSAPDLQRALARPPRWWSSRPLRTRTPLRGDRPSCDDRQAAQPTGSANCSAVCPRVPPVGGPPSHSSSWGPPPRIATFGPDLLVVPAGFGMDGTPAGPAEEAAAMVARARIWPVLRVRRRPMAMRGWLLLIAGAPGCDRLAAGLLRSGLWPSAAVSILPVGDFRPRVRAMVEAQTELLRSHGRAATVLKPVDLDFEAPALAGRIGRFEAAVASGLSNRWGWFFGSARNCTLEAVAETVPLLLVP